MDYPYITLPAFELSMIGLLVGSWVFHDTSSTAYII